MDGLKAANLAGKFLLELAALAAFAYWGSTVGNGQVAVLAASPRPWRRRSFGVCSQLRAPRAGCRSPRA